MLARVSVWPSSCAPPSGATWSASRPPAARRSSRVWNPLQLKRGSVGVDRVLTLGDQNAGRQMVEQRLGIVKRGQNLLGRILLIRIESICSAVVERLELGLAVLALESGIGRQFGVVLIRNTSPCVWRAPHPVNGRKAAGPTSWNA